MGYTIEISIDVRKPNMLIKNVKERRIIAEEHLCEMQYFMHEIEGKKRTTIRSDSIHVVHFSEEQFTNLLNYIKQIRRDKSLYIECIYRDDIEIKLLFVSPKYLQKMDKDISKRYQKEIKKNIIDDEKIAIKQAFNLS